MSQQSFVPPKKHEAEVACTRKCRQCESVTRAWKNQPFKTLPFVIWCPACGVWYDATSTTTESPNITGGDLQP